MPPYTHTLSLSLGGDVPTWEGEVTVEYGVYDAADYSPQIDDLRVTKIDGLDADLSAAELLEAHIEGSDRLCALLIEHAVECDAERDAERVRG